MRLLIAITALALWTGLARAQDEHSLSWLARAKVACIADVTRLCASALPSMDEVRDCMKDKKGLVSARCAEFYPGGKNAF